MASLGPHFVSSASSSDQSERSSPGPLRSLRLSSLSPESGHAHGKHRSAHLAKTAGKKQYVKKIQAKKTHPDPGFELDVRFPATRTSFAPAHDSPASFSYGDSQIATIFANTAKNARAKYNIVDSLNPKELGDFAASPSGTPVVVSPATRRRADAVKSALELKFAWIRKVQDAGIHDENSYPGSDGCYNPLQVLRNRATRKKLGHPPPRAPPHPLPCDAFSAHFSRGAKSWKMLWGVDFDEIVADYAWRRVFWPELRNARGELWYPEAAARQNSQNLQNTQNTHNTPESKRKMSQRLHDRLWNDSDSDKVEAKKSNWKEKAKRLYGSSASAVDLPALSGMSPIHAPSKSVDGVSGMKFARLGKNSSVDDTPNQYQYSFQFARSGDLEDFLNTDFSQADVLPPQIVIEDSPPNVHSGAESQGLSPGMHDAPADVSTDNVTDVMFSPAHKKQPSVQHLEAVADPAANVAEKVDKTTNPETGPGAGAVDDTQLEAAYHSARCLEAVSFLSTNYLSVVYPQLLHSTTAKLDVLMQDRMQNLLWSINQANAAQLPARENLYKGFIEEAKSITHLANAECAVKIDNLLSATDRSYSELNTSLIMELRRANEKLDDLGRSLFSGVMGNSPLSDDVARDYVTDHKLVYKVLENVIVVFLRLVWIGVNVIKPVVLFFRLVWKLLSVLFT